MPPAIISASRRTDIPAFFADWFMGRIRAGHVFSPNPLYPSQKTKAISLKPEDVYGIVFWTRNARPLMPHLDELDRIYGGRLCFHYTINALPRELEERNPPMEEAVGCFRELAARYPGMVFWRYDPVVISSITGSKWHEERFSGLCSRLEGAAQRCYFSFLDDYRKTISNLEKLNARSSIDFSFPSEGERTIMAKKLRDIARPHGITLYSCCEEVCEQVPGVEKAHCIDGELFHRFAGKRRNYRAEPTREACGCVKSRDIGRYDSCPHGCLYCYANQSPAKARDNYRAFAEAGRRWPEDGPTSAAEKEEKADLFSLLATGAALPDKS